MSKEVVYVNMFKNITTSLPRIKHVVNTPIYDMLQELRPASSKKISQSLRQERDNIKKRLNAD